MKNLNLNKVQRLFMIALALGATVLQSTSGQAGAVSCDSRNCAWGTARANEGDPNQQFSLAVRRAENRGGSSPYIRAYQFNLSRGTWVVYMTGYVVGKGYCGNWGYSLNYNQAFDNAFNGLWRQGATQINWRTEWQE